MELSDRELVILWHRLNMLSKHFYDNYNPFSDTDIPAVHRMDQISSRILWTKLDNECTKRGINPQKGIKKVTRTINEDIVL